MPDAVYCVGCVEASGDVLPIKRLDEFTKDGIVETYFQKNKYAEKQIRRLTNSFIPSGAFATEAGQ